MTSPVLVTELFIEQNHDESIVVEMPDDMAALKLEPADHTSAWYYQQLLLLLEDANDNVNIVVFVSDCVWSQLGAEIASKSGSACRLTVIVAKVEQLPALKLRGGSKWAQEQVERAARGRRRLRPSSLTAWAAKVNVAALASRLPSHPPGQQLAFVDAGIVDGRRRGKSEMVQLGAILASIAGNERVAFASVGENRQIGVWPSAAWFGGSPHAIQQFDEHIAALVSRLDGIAGL